MKKKNVIGHMEASKDHSVGWFRRLGILPRLLCLLLAILIWHVVVNVTADSASFESADVFESKQESQL